MIALTNTITETKDVVVLVISSYSPLATDHQAVGVYAFDNYGDAIVFARNEKLKEQTEHVIIKTLEGIMVL